MANVTHYSPFDNIHYYSTIQKKTKINDFNHYIIKQHSAILANALNYQ
jgi:hypothetical protein